jgi:hypothetical protein
LPTYALANSLPQSRFWQSGFRLSFQYSVRRKTEFPQPHKNDQGAAPVPSDCAKTVVSIPLRRLKARIAEPKTKFDMQPWNTARATIYGVTIGLSTAAEADRALERTAW